MTVYMKCYCLGIIAIMVVVLSAAEAVASLSATTAKAGRQGNKYVSTSRMGAPRHLHTTRTLSTVRNEIPPLSELGAFSSSSHTCDSHVGRCPFVKPGIILNNAGFAPAIPISGMCGGYYITQDVTPGFVFPVRAYIIYLSLGTHQSVDVEFWVILRVCFYGLVGMDCR